MQETVVDIERIDRVYGDRILVRRLGEPEKKRGILVPIFYANKKEPKKVWFGEVVSFGHESKANTDYGINITDWIGIEPLGSHYASFKGDDGNDYVWVPDEHICMLDEGSIRAYFQDRLDREKAPMFRVIGDRLLLREIQERESGIIRVHREDERQAKVSEVIALGDVSEDCKLKIMDRVIHVTEDSGSSCLIDIYDPNLIVLRSDDLIARLNGV